MKPTDWEYGQAFTDGVVVRFAVGTKTYGERWATVDAADWPDLAPWRWRAVNLHGIFYARCSKGGQRLLHRVLLEPPRDRVVDHIDGNGLNNCRANIRVCTLGENTIFGADRRRGGTLDIKRAKVATKPHVVTKILADGTRKKYAYETRSKAGTKTVKIVKFIPDGKLRDA